MSSLQKNVPDVTTVLRYLTFLQRSQGPGKSRVDGQELDLNTGLILQEFQQAAGLHCLTADDVERRRNQ